MHVADPNNPYRTPRQEVAAASWATFKKSVWFGVLRGVFLALLTIGAVLGALLAIGIAFAGFARGRQLRRHGRLVLAPLARRSAWADGVDSEPRIAAPDEVAEAWRTNGLTEHASVAAFARV